MDQTLAISPSTTTPLLEDLLIFRFSAALLSGRAYVDVNLFVSTKEPSAENKERRHHDDHKNRQNRYDADTASTTVVSHNFPPVNSCKTDLRLTRGSIAPKERQDFTRYITRVNL